MWHTCFFEDTSNLYAQPNMARICREPDELPASSMLLVHLPYARALWTDQGTIMLVVFCRRWSSRLLLWQVYELSSPCAKDAAIAAGRALYRQGIFMECPLARAAVEAAELAEHVQMIERTQGADAALPLRAKRDQAESLFRKLKAQFCPDGDCGGDGGGGAQTAQQPEQAAAAAPTEAGGGGRRCSKPAAQAAVRFGAERKVH
jgi:hypothetical protein